MTSHNIGSTGFPRVLLAAFAAAVLGSSTLTAHASTTNEDASSVSVSVSYADLDLSTEQGTLVLYHRIVNAANKICADHSSGLSVKAAADSRKCVNEAIARAVNDVQSPQLVALRARMYAAR